MNDKSIEVIKKSFNENKNSHAFLIETNNLDNTLNDVINIIFSINNISREINLENIPDIKIIYPDGKEIKREQVSVILDEFQTFPIELKHRYYIIVQSESMNQASANTILKFLEEPDNTVIGFFLTTNKRAMINTIVSRCQHYKFFYEAFIDYDQEKVMNFLNLMNSSMIYKRIMFLNDFFSKDRNENIKIFKNIKNYLSNSDNIDSQKIKLLVKRVTLLDNIIEKLLKNANQELVILDLARNWK